MMEYEENTGPDGNGKLYVGILIGLWLGVLFWGHIGVGKRKLKQGW